jgi:DNA polymerase IV
MSVSASASTSSISDYKPLIVEALTTMRLGELAAETDKDKDKAKFSAISYSKAIASLKRFDGPITAAIQIKELDGIGVKIYKKIEEILATGGLVAAERVKETTNVGAVQSLLNLHGIGPVKVKELLAAGIKTVEELRSAFPRDPGLLTSAQALGLKYYEAGLLRIPRPEMVEHERTLLSAVTAPLTGVIVGSYRRGAADSGDIDMLVSYGTGVAEKDAKKAFAAFVASLSTSGYVVDKLSSGPKKWMGYVRLPVTASGGAGGTGGPTVTPLVRRLDLLLTPPEEFAYSILYFTGSDKFNVAMRKYVLTLGYSLSEHGLKLADEGRARPMPATPPRTEADIFTFFGLRYVAPTERVDGRQIVPLVALD